MHCVPPLAHEVRLDRVDAADQQRKYRQGEPAAALASDTTAG